MIKDLAIIKSSVRVNNNLVDNFCNFLDVSQKTILTYKKALNQFFIYIKRENIANPVREDIIKGYNNRAVLGRVT